MSLLRSLWLVPLAIICLTQSGSAQTSVYGTVAISAFGISPVNSSALSFKSDAPGFVLGGFYNFPIASRVTVGLDLRLADSPGAKGGTAGALALRVGFVPHQVRLRPYFELGGGVLSTSTNTELVNDQVRAGTYTGGAAILVFGLDIRLTRSIDLRAIELASEASGSAGTGYVDAGVVFHFGSR